MPENEIFLTQDGSHSLRSGRFGVNYRSKYGAVRESRHVFIEEGLYPMLLRRQSLNVLEIGFGTGLSALQTLWESKKRDFPIRYTAIEPFPLSIEEVSLLNYFEWFKDFPDAREAFLALHRADWDAGFTEVCGMPFQKLSGEILDYPDLTGFDLIYFDPFSPDILPQVWEPDILANMHEALNEGGLLATYCAKGIVKRRLRDAGFEVETVKGPPGKREIVRAGKGSF